MFSSSAWKLEWNASTWVLLGADSTLEVHRRRMPSHRISDRSWPSWGRHNRRWTHLEESTAMGHRWLQSAYQIIQVCFRMLRLLLNQMDCNYHNAAVMETISYRKCSKWLPLHEYGVCYATVRSPHPRCSVGIQSVRTSRCFNLQTRPHPWNKRSCSMPQMR